MEEIGLGIGKIIHYRRRRTFVDLSWLGYLSVLGLTWQWLYLLASIVMRILVVE